MSLKERIKSQHGYLTDRDIKDAEKELGRNFEVIVKTGYGERHRIALKNVDHFEKNLKNDYIREIFVSADDYKRIFY